MDLGIISMRYAKALLRFAEEHKEDKQVYDETAQLAETYLTVPALQQAMLNPVLTDAQKETFAYRSLWQSYPFGLARSIRKIGAQEATCRSHALCSPLVWYALPQAKAHH